MTGISLSLRVLISIGAATAGIATAEFGPLLEAKASSAWGALSWPKLPESPSERTLTLARIRVPAPTPAPPTEPRDEIDMVFDAADADVETAMGSQMKRGKVIGGATPHRMILFTFDDGPDRRTTPKLLRYLDEANVKAVFFVTTNRIEGIGDRVRAQRELLADIVARGHFVGNHTANHRQLPLLDYENIIYEIKTAEHAIESVTGVRPYLFRPPGGSRSARTDRILASAGYTQMLWNVGAGDFQVRTADDVVSVWRRVLERRERENDERGGIVLLHDTHPWSVEAFPRIVSEIRGRNCDLLAAGEELFDIVDDPALFFAARGESDATEMAPPAQPPAGVIAARQARLRDATQRRCQAVAYAQ